MAKKLTVDNIIENKINIETKDVVEFESKTLGGIIEIHKIPRAKFQSIMTKLKEAKSEQEQNQLEDRLIYECIPLLQNKKLQDAYEVKAPYDIVSKVFNDNIMELNQISDIIYKFYGINVQELEAVKKQ